MYTFGCLSPGFKEQKSRVYDLFQADGKVYSPHYSSVTARSFTFLTLFMEIISCGAVMSGGRSSIEIRF